MKFMEEHRLMTYQQVIDRYGPPDGLTVMDNGQVYWSYSIELPGGSMVSRSFFFYDGMVMRAGL